MQQFGRFTRHAALNYPQQIHRQRREHLRFLARRDDRHAAYAVRRMHRGIGIRGNRDGSRHADAPFDLSRQHLRRPIQGFEAAHVENHRVRRILFYIRRKPARAFHGQRQISGRMETGEHTHQRTVWKIPPPVT